VSTGWTQQDARELELIRKALERIADFIAVVVVSQAAQGE
jgi:hypothetical protein